MMTKSEIEARTAPGTHPADVTLEDMRPCGRCDGVLWLGGGVVATEDSTAPDGVKLERIDATLCEKEAHRYLKPMPPIWRALNKGMIGVARPHGVEVLFPKEAFALEKSTGRPLQWMFNCEEHGIFAAHPRYREPDMCWRVVKVSPWMWVFLFDPPAKASGAAGFHRQPEPKADAGEAVAPVTPDLKQVVEAETAKAEL